MRAMLLLGLVGCAGVTPPPADPVPLAGLPEVEADRERERGEMPTPMLRSVRPLETSPRPASGGGPRSLDRRIDLDLSQAPLAEVFRLLADAATFNVVLADDVSGSVTVRLQDVRIRDALRALAATHGLTLEWEGNVLLVRKGSSRGSG